MVTNNENEILFDDVSILTKLTGNNYLINASPNNDCDCTSNFTNFSQDESDTHQIAPPLGQSN